MGFFSKMLQDVQANAEKLLQEANKNTGGASNTNEVPPTRWEKAVVALNGIVGQVSTIDPDGIDIFAFPGGSTANGGVDAFRNIHDTSGLEAMVTAKTPAGPCHMGAAMDMVLQEAFQKGFAERPCSILVLTAGQPEDHEALTAALSDAAQKVEKDSDLTVTFVQIGDDEQATEFLTHLDKDLTTTSANGETIDIVDVIKDEDLQKAVGDQQSFLKSGGGGALLGAFAGAAMGVGGMYLANKLNANKRTQGWNGTWKLMQDGTELATFTVEDDGNGNLNLRGWPGMEEVILPAEYADQDGAFTISYTDPKKDVLVEGTIEDEHNIAWSNGTRWQEVPPADAHWTAYAGAAAAGAASAGTAGYLLQKKFFQKAANQVPSDYVIVLDRSAMMAVPDTGK